MCHYGTWCSQLSDRDERCCSCARSKSDREYHESINYVLKDHPGLIFRYPLFFVYLSLKGFPVAVLDYEDFQVFVFVNVVAFKKVITVTHVHQFRLWLCESELNFLDDGVGLIFDFAHVDDFDCDLPFGFIVHALVDAAVWADADEVIDYVDIDDEVLEGEASLFILFVGEC